MCSPVLGHGRLNAPKQESTCLSDAEGIKEEEVKKRWIKSYFMDINDTKFQR
jgi:hypothetical protein